MRALILLAACAALATAAPPTPERDTAANEALKEAHDRGAALYNSGDAAGCLRLYEGALIMTKTVLASRPKLLAEVETALGGGLTALGTRDQAFELHKLIERVRGELKRESAAEVPPVPAPNATPAPKPDPAPPVKPAMAPKLDPAPAPPSVPEPRAEARPGVTLQVRLAGKPIKNVAVVMVSTNLPKPRVISLGEGAGGAFVTTGPVPDGEYRVIVTGDGVPSKYATTGTTPLKATVDGGKLEANLELAGGDNGLAR